MKVLTHSKKIKSVFTPSQLINMIFAIAPSIQHQRSVIAGGTGNAINQAILEDYLAVTATLLKSLMPKYRNLMVEDLSREFNIEIK